MGRNEADAVRSARRKGKNADEYKELFLEKEFKNNGVRSCFLPYVGKIC